MVEQQISSEETPLIGSSSSEEEFQVSIKSPDDIPLAIPKHRHTVTPSQRRYGYTLCGLASITQALRATGLHAILSMTPIPLSISFLSMAVIFNVLSIIGLFIYKIKPWPILKRRRTFLVWCFRALSGSVMKYLNFVSLKTVDVGIALTIFATAPSMASVFAFIFLRDPISFSDIGILIVNIIGVLFVVSPGSSAESTVEGAVASSTSFLSTGLMAAIGCAFFQAATTNMEKSLSSDRIHVMMVLLAIGIGSTISYLALIRWEDYALIPVYPMATVGLFIVSFLTFITHGLLNYSMRYCRPGLVLVVRSLSVPFSFFLGYFFLFEVPSLWQVFGVCLVLTSLVFIGLG